MHKMEMLRDRLCDELDELAGVEKISTSSLDAIDKLTHSIKSIDTILAMEQSGYSNGLLNIRSSGRLHGSVAYRSAS